MSLYLRMWTVNNRWIYSSLRTKTMPFRGGWVNDEYEFWLDCMGLIETNWLLFAGLNTYKESNFGYPGADIESD